MKKSKVTRKFKKKETLPIRILNAFLILSFFGMIAAFAIIAYFNANTPEIDLQSMIVPNDSFVYDKDGNMFAKLSRKEFNQTNIQYNMLNQGLVNILVGTEDSSFFKHKGVDILNTIESFITTGLLKQTSSGASTITQQLIGTTQLDRQDRSFTRKLNEILLSFKAEQQVNKEEIVELYFNYFFFGRNNIHGVELASSYFFTQRANSVDPVQSAILVGTLNSPVNYNPLGGYNEFREKYMNGSQERLSEVLMASHNQGYLSDDEYALLDQVKVENTVKISELDTNNDYIAYLDVVRQELESKYKIDLSKESLHIHTTLDPATQGYADSIY
ncbi:MAG: transglycosylase domain-containing protein, partial [Bacilli bacterium]